MKSPKGVIFAFLVFASSLLGAIFLLFPLIPLAHFKPKLWRTAADRLVGFWLTFPCSLVEWVFGVKFRVSGDLIRRDEPAILIMNHRTRLDWLFLWNALYKMDPWLLISEKISLKAPLKRIPGAGWAMSCGSYIFLERNFENDKPELEKMIKYYAEMGKNYQILLFVEGTDKGERATNLSHAYADKMGLERYEHVLHPRTTGFTFLLDLMKKEYKLKNVYDLTIAYDGEIIDTEMKMVKEGLFPKKVHVDVKRVEIEDILEENPSQWLTQLWKSKEDRLRRFYDQNEENRVLEASGDRFVWPEALTGTGYVVAFSFWCVATLCWILYIYSSIWVKMYAIAAIGFYLLCLKFFNGAEHLFIQWAAEKSKAE
ncbi:unnamed protein product [Caenorhabditis bovis]|uniref:Phospholipid/glycerol acyltransferase domain-containing protein n=1 Tax=Caenorhabditis bovis TaxID=2654633 RepID=A0A8S1EAB4_9PELO|nr:unnamed protein product [Caenorhabditis bovis]